MNSFSNKVAIIADGGKAARITGTVLPVDGGVTAGRI